jgi:acyl carrier protein
LRPNEAVKGVNFLAGEGIFMVYFNKFMNIFKRFISKRKQQLSQIKEEKRQELFLKIKDSIAKILGMPDKEKIVLSSRLTDDLGVDSLTSIELIMELEEKFCIEIPDEDAETIITVKDIVDYIENKISG